MNDMQEENQTKPKQQQQKKVRETKAIEFLQRRNN